MLNARQKVEFRKSLSDVLDFAGSTFVSATFRKKDGSVRRIVFNPRMGREGTPTGERFRTGEGMAYSPTAYGLLPVIDVFLYRRGEARAWRNVNFNTLDELKVRGFTFKVDWNKMTVSLDH